MRRADPITFERQRGIVWVCDVKDSTSALNNEKTVDSVEEYLPRLMWIGEQIVEASGGEFIKWTGDGFLAWYKCELERNRGMEAAAIFDAAWHLSFSNNVTNLNVNSEKKFQLRHGIAWEPDALIMNISHNNNTKAKDLLGRNIVFAFRISGISVAFPHIVTQSSLINDSKNKISINHHFEKLSFEEEDVLKYFKGEKRGVRYIMGSSSLRKKSTHYKKALLNQIDFAINKSEKNKINSTRYLDTVNSFRKRLMAGPDWAKKILLEEEKFIKKDMIDSLLKSEYIINNIKNVNKDKKFEKDFINYLSIIRSIIEN